MKTFVIGDIHGRRTQFRNLLDVLPRDAWAGGKLVLLGDLIDRGEDVRGTVTDVLELCREAPSHVVVLRGNHEQMLLDFIDGHSRLWLHPATGSEPTFEHYTGRPLMITSERDIDDARAAIKLALSGTDSPIDFFRRLPLYYEDDFAIYVHAGLEPGKHPSETSPQHLLWSRDFNFFKNYTGKPCVFGHTPTPLLPLRGRLGRHGIYICHSAIGIDTGYGLRGFEGHVVYGGPLSCLSLPDFALYQSFADGHIETHHITTFIPQPLRALQNENRGKRRGSPNF